MHRRAPLVALALAVLSGCRPEPAAIAEPFVHRGGGPCGGWVLADIVEAEVPANERARLWGPDELLRQVAVYRARARGVEPDTSSQCGGPWERRVLVSGPDRGRLETALDSVGAPPSPLRFPPRDSLWHVRADLDLGQISELMRSPAVTSMAGLPVTCGYITRAGGRAEAVARGG